MTATQLLKEDHAKVKKLFREFGRTTDRAVKTRQRLVDEIATELDVHAKIEEEIFYPAVARIESLAGLVEESREEHDKLKALVAEVQGMSPDDEEIERKLKTLRDVVLHHASEEEEGKMFPQVQQALGRQELDRLGSELESRKRELLEGTVGRLSRAIKKGIRKAA